MNQYVRYQTLVVPKKLRVEVRVAIDKKGGEYSSTTPGGDRSVSVSFFPIVSLNIIRPSELDENGRRKRAPWNPNDSLGMSKFNLPIMIRNLKEIQSNLKIQDLYTYQGKRLELNEVIAEKVRSPFPIGNMIVELSATVIVQPDDSRIEGIKMKFNNEQSSVLLTINELDALIYSLDHMDIDSIALLMYLNYIEKPDHPTSFTDETLTPKIDILPKDEFKNLEE